MDPGEVRAAVERAHRQDWAAVLAATLRTAGSLDLAEDCTQDAYVRALRAWQRDGIPRNPAAWLTTAARRNALDVHRRSANLRSKLPELLPQDDTRPDGFGGDERLRLIFTCCHPALAREAQVGLTLRLVCGLSTADIARSFLVNEATMAARVTRAKKKIAAAGIPYRVPAAPELADRLDAVLTVIHLVFTAGHTAPSGPELDRVELAERAIELTRVLVQLMPDEREARGLLALMLADQARRPGRRDGSGAPVLLAEQDRSRWNRSLVDEADALLVDALRGGRPGRFVLQAAVALVHAQAPSYADTDWVQIVGLYDLLLACWPSPVVALNRAVALGMADGPQAGLAAMAGLELPGYHYLPAARAELYRQLGRAVEAGAQYELALAQVGNEAERRFLLARAAEVGAEPRHAAT